MYFAALLPPLQRLLNKWGSTVMNDPHGKEPFQKHGDTTGYQSTYSGVIMLSRDRDFHLTHPLGKAGNL